MISSHKGKEMILNVSPIYNQNKVMNAIFQAIGNEADLSEEFSEDVSNQLFVQTATWGLDFWEDSVGIPINKTKSYEFRRVKILAKMQTINPVTPNRIRRIVETITKQDVEIVQNVADYTFAIVFKNAETLNIDFMEIIDDIKPAHLSFRVESNINRRVVIKNQVNTGRYKVPITNRYPTGVWPWVTNRARVNDSLIKVKSSNDYGKSVYPTTGRLITSPYLYKQVDSIRYIEYIRKLTINSMHDARDPNILTTNDFLTGTRPWLLNKAYVNDSKVISFSEPKYGFNKYVTTGRFMPSGKLPFTEYVANAYVGEVSTMIQRSNEREGIVTFPESNTFLSGEIPWMQERANVNDSKESSRSKHIHGPVKYPVTGVFRTGKEIK